MTPPAELLTQPRMGLRGTVEAVCVVHQLVSDPGQVGVTAIDKRPVEGPVRVRALGLHGDVQADRKHHGGRDKAVYAYSQDDAEWWATRLSQPVPPGRFGENLRVSGLDVDAARAGERWRIGETVVLEVTRPRIPCATFGRWLQEKSWVKRFLQAGRPGTYLRVITSGQIQAGDAVVVLSEGPPGPTMRETALTKGPATARPHD